MRTDPRNWEDKLVSFPLFAWKLATTSQFVRRGLALANNRPQTRRSLLQVHCSLQAVIADHERTCFSALQFTLTKDSKGSNILITCSSCDWMTFLLWSHFVAPALFFPSQSGGWGAVKDASFKWPGNGNFLSTNALLECSFEAPYSLQIVHWLPPWNIFKSFFNLLLQH